MIRTSSMAALLLLSACGDALVGGACRPGLEAREGRCLAPESPRGDAGLPDLGWADGGLVTPDATVPRDAGPLPDSAQPLPDSGVVVAADAGHDAGEPPPPRCDLGELECDGSCVRPSTERAHCGGCGIACGATEVCASGACAPTCAAPLVMCGAVCTDVSSDPDHCGACGNRCASGICEDGACVSALAGHVVVVGHDYSTGRRGMNRVAGNAVFLATGSTVGVLGYEGAASAASVRGIDAAVDQVAGERGRAWSKWVADAREVPLLLADSGALIVYPQSGADDATLRDLGRRWSVALRSFVDRGGVIVLFDGPGANAGTWQIADEAGLFHATARLDVSSDVVRVVSPADAVALTVPLSYRGERATVRFVTSDPSVVVTHDEGPVVLHRVFAR